MNRKIEPVLDNLGNILPRKKWEWLLFFFIIGSLTLSHIKGASMIVILYGILFTGFFFLYFLFHKKSLKVPSEVILYSLWIIWSLGGLVNVRDTTLYFTQLSTIIQFWILIFLVTSIIALHRNISSVMLSIAVGGIIVAISSVISGDFQRIADMGVRNESLAGNPNEFAYVLLFVICSMFYFLNPHFSVRRFWRIILSMIIFISFVFIVLSGSRKGLLGGIAFLFLWWIFSQVKKISKTQIKGFVILLFVLVGIYFGVNAVMSNATIMGNRLRNLDDSGNQKRVQMYLDGFEMIKEHPFLGVGLDNYRVHSSSRLYSHSDFIEVAANTGIIGFILYFSIYPVLWLRISRLKAMTNDPQLLYIIGLMKATIIVIFLLSFGRPNINSKLTWIFLAAAIGYTWSMKNSLKSIKLYRNNLPRNY